MAPVALPLVLVYFLKERADALQQITVNYSFAFTISCMNIK
ncbi:hypothetical protein LLB_1787 [Legionella longbeachae D-4968]|nr:hypothetical protein LLB_1787 [Legionella longbeachae D-4968]